MLTAGRWKLRAFSQPKKQAQIRAALERILKDKQDFNDSAAEDVHSFVEARLIELTGDLGRKLHTGRSRNDQVATDFRLWLRTAIDDLNEALRDAQTSLLDFAEAHREVVIPGYTHLQRAQPVLLAHWCLAYFEMLARDRERLGRSAPARERSATRFSSAGGHVLSDRS